MKRLVLLTTVLFALVTCRLNNSVDSVEPVHGEGLAGTWLLYETGSSPGFGYTITTIAPQPKQTLTFTVDGQMQAQGDALKSYQAFNRYRVDTLNKAMRIHFSPSATDYSEAIYRSGDTLKLSPLCYEGCHSGFIRIK